MLLTDHLAHQKITVTPELLVRFWQRVKRTEECWEWRGATRVGYGAIKIDGRVWETHRVAWMFRFGDIPSGMFICHRCDNRRCVKPNHLFAGTQKDNVHDAQKKGRHFQPVGEQVGTAMLTEKKVRLIRKMAEKGQSIVNVARKLNLNYNTTWDVIRRRRWKHVK